MRILSLAPSNTEILFALGSGGSIVGRTAYCDYPKEAINIPKVGSWTEPDMTTLRSLKPDLVLTSTIVQERLAEMLEGEGYAVAHIAPRTMYGVLESIIGIGKLVGKEDEGRTLVSSMRAELDSIRTKASGQPHRPRLYIEEWHDPPFVSGNWVPGLAKIAGAEYELIDEGEYSREITDNEIKESDPELIILSICGVRSTPELIKKRASWANISAVRECRIHAFDDSLLNRPGPRLVEGCRKIADLISFSGRTSA